MVIREDLTLGIDLGIGSCGWAVIKQSDSDRSDVIVGLGVWLFDVPEKDKDRTPTNQIRRQHRGLRHVIGRRRQRMNAIRGLFRDNGLLGTDGKDAFRVPGLDPWRLRAEGLDRALTAPELAVTLVHIAKHRGFKSNSKRDRGANAPKESSDMLKAIATTRDRLKDYRTVGEMFVKHPDYAGRKRNRDGDYSRSLLRDDLLNEVRLLFDRQRRLGSRLAPAELERQFCDIAFSQRPLADSEDRVGPCPFAAGQKRAAKHAYSFELFRLLSRLAALRIRSGRDSPSLTADEIAAASADFGTYRGMTFGRLRRILNFGDDIRFEGISFEDEGKRDVVARSGNAAPGTYTLRKVLGDAWRTLLGVPEKLDRIAFVLSFREDVTSIRAGLKDIGLEPLVLDVLMKGVENGDFSDFRGAGHISAEACRSLIPYLKNGLVYSDACKAAGYDHAKRPGTDLSEIANPVARKALTEALKQVRAIVQEYGVPGRIHVELARDVGKSQEERDEISYGIERRNKEKDRLRVEFRETVGTEPTEAEDLLRFELWKEQHGRCLYTDREIHPNAIVASDNSVQVDHILPWSRSGDDSFINKTLCVASANQAKKGRTPFEWFNQEKPAAEWDAFTARVETNKAMKGRKKRNLLLKDAAVLEEKFRPRNLNDTRYATRLLADTLRRTYPDDGTRRIFARPGPLTDRLRRAWGVQYLKKTPDGKRIDDDRHHALDALVVAATSEAVLQRLTRTFQEAERRGDHRDFRQLCPPWPEFVQEARDKLASVFVARAERRRARGEAHAATIRQISERNGKIVIFERRPVAALKESDLERIKDPERNKRLIDSLRQWIAAGKPKDRQPLSPKGDPVTKVRLSTNKKADVLVRDGAAERGEMVRVDVFRKKNRKGVWEFFLVPIYPHQVADVGTWPRPPNRAVQASKPEDQWPEVTPNHEFLWSLYSFSYILVEKSDGMVIEGYYRGLHRGTGAIDISLHFSRDIAAEGIGGRTLKSFSKYAVDRLGRRFEINRETRTWHGAACT
jgi:CRISPR-associated endonuclease Csn1